MWGINLRAPPTRPPPAFDPIVEAWLDSLPPPTTKPSFHELRQWRLSNYHGLGRSVFVTCVILRMVSLLVALSVTGVIASVVARRQGPFDAVERLVPCLVVCPIVALWNTAEFIAAYVFRDGGVPPNIHVVVDSILFLGVATAMGTLLVDVICGVADFGSVFNSAAEEISCVCLLVVLMVIHSFLLFFFICNHVENTRKKSRAAAGHDKPRYPHVAVPWPGERLVDKATPLTTPEPLKIGHITTVELKDLDPKPRQEPPEFEISVHPEPATNPTQVAALETSALAQAMAGLWDIEAGPHSPATPSRSYEGAISSEADHQPPPMVRYL